MFFIGIILGFSFWIIDPIIDVLLFHRDNIITEMFSPSSHEVFTRLLLSGVIIAFSIYANYALNKQKRIENQLNAEKKRYRQIADFIPDAIAVHCQGRFVYANTAAAKLIGINDPKEITGRKILEFVSPEYREIVKQRVESTAKEGIISQLIEEEFVKADGTLIPVEVAASPFTFQEKPAIIVAVRDITQRKQAEEALRITETKFKELTDSLPEIVFEINAEGVITYANRNAFKYFGVSEDNLNERLHALDFIAPEDRQRAKQNINQAMNGKNLGEIEYFALKKDGSKFPVVIHSSPIVQNGRTNGLRGLIIDISERKKAEHQLKYVSEHDKLTNLYNRFYFEKQISIHKQTDTSLGLIICDLDGLKLINDTLGHDQGDRVIKAAAEIIKSICREGNIAARIGGDEFIILVPNANELLIKDMVSELRSSSDIKVKSHQENLGLPISVSCGYAVSGNGMKDINELFKTAENFMYREKLYHNRSNRSALVAALMKALEERDFNTQGHADRLQQIIVNLANAAGLPPHHETELRLLAQFHDIGKVGVPDKILLKEGPLNNEEMTEMKRHCEIGYRIAQSAPDLIIVADWILKHHERWDGAGYPLGLKGEQIPIECRILAIADAFDAMTNDRPYRKAMSTAAAINELKRCAGKQFDPFLVKMFCQKYEVDFA